MSIIERNKIIGHIDALNDQIEERWDTLTTKQVSELKDGIEALWRIICRRQVKR